MTGRAGDRRRRFGPPVRAIAVAAGFVLAPIACSHPQRSAEPPAPASPIEVSVARVGGAGDDWVEVPGTVEAVRTAAVASRVSATVESVPVEIGDLVREGDPVVRLDGRDLEAHLQAAEAALAAADARLERLRALFEKEAATRDELDAATAAAAGARAVRDAARVQIEYVDLRAPFDGRVTTRQVHAGDLAGPGQTLVTIQGTGRLRVAATVSEDQAARLTIGRAVRAILEDGRAAEAVVSVLGASGDPASRRFIVKGDLPRDAGARAGTFARLRLPRGGEDPLALVPLAAVFERGALTGVFVVEGGTARLRWIRPGARSGGHLFVRAGLEPGDEVILEPRGIEDGTPVRGRAGNADAPQADPAQQESRK